MRNHIFFIFCLMSLGAFSQQQYQSLLWKISGNGLKEDSYLYGTMHVSSKVAYRLDDVFYRSLLKAETIALESDPGTWLESSYEDMNMSDLNFYLGAGGEDFYAGLFELDFPENAVVRRAIRFDNNIINAYLYRKNQGTDNFEEETYLDMFIYQAGKKNNKPVIALEDLDESRYLTTKASFNPVKKNPDPWVQKLFEKENPLLIQENAYRDRNLDLLDSIGNAINTNFFRKNMLYKRNENMVDKLETLLKKTTVFAGVGAAHLPGEQGMIAMLRKRGYSVTPLTSEQTNYARAKKEELEKLFVETPLKLESTPDNLISLNSFDTLWEFVYLGQKFYVAPDMANGAYLAITRINTYDYLPGEKRITLDEIDDLLYEDIPGDIIKKEKIATPFPGISILNKTKKGDYQKYHIYKTPLEIIVIKFGGKRDYVLRNEDKIFSSISFKTPSAEWETLHEASGKYQVLIPENYSIENYLNEGKKVIQSWYNDEYFFLQETPVYELNYIEEDAFEASYFHERFYKNYELKQEQGKFTDFKYSSYGSAANIDSLGTRKLHLKTIVKDDSYYMLGYVGENAANAGRFFNSFRFTTLKEEKFEKVTDTSLHFSVLTNVKPKLFSAFNYKSFKDDTKPYEEQEKQALYTAKHNEKIFINRKKFHDLHMYEAVDSLWAEIDREYKKDFTISRKQKTSSEAGYSYSFILKDTASVKNIRVKNLLKEGTLFELKTIEEDLAEPSEFVTSFYDSFTPLDTLLGQDIFKDKTPQFFDALRKNDSIILESYRHIKFNEKNTGQIIDVLSNYEFPEDRKHIKTYLIGELGKMKNEKAWRYLSDLYVKSYAEPQIQTTILAALLAKNNESSYEQFLDLLESDFPLSGSEIRLLFKNKKRSLKLMKKLFPELLDYVAVEEYKAPVYELLATLKDSNYIKARDYKKYKNQILNDARVEIKRHLGNKNSSNNYYKKNYILLEHYTKLLFPFRKDKKTALFFNNLLNGNDRNALTTYYVLLQQQKEAIPEKLAKTTLENTENVYMLAEKLQQHKLISASAKIEQQRYARSKLFEKARYNESRDSITFIRKSKLHIDKLKNPVIVYFYKLKRNYRPSDNYQLYYIAFEKKNNLNTTPYFISNTNGIYVRPAKTLDEYIEEALTVVKHKTRKRINSKKNRFGY